MSTFAVDVSKWCEKSKQNGNQVLRAVALELLRRMVLRSPVGNPELWASKRAGAGYVGGRFRGNWQVTFGTPALEPIDRIDPSGGATIGEAIAILADAQLGVTIFMMNNVPYAELLEYGWSTQAPEGVVRVTAAEFEGIVEDVSGEVNS